MKAAVFYGPGDLRIEERLLPQIGPGQVLIRVAACGICGTDYHIYHGEFQTRPPVIIGHEFSGQVAAIGHRVEDLAPGDRVTVDPNTSCGMCRPCRRGQTNLCENNSAVGVMRDGGFAEFCVVPQEQCHLLPRSVSLLQGAMTEPLACCVHGIDLASVRPGDTVVVIGGGAIGQMLAQLARLRGAARLVLSEPIPDRREMALSLGVDVAIDPLNDDPLAPGGTLEGGADVVIEAVGSVPTSNQAIEWAAPGATVLWFGVTPPGQVVPVDPNLIFRKELTIRGALINPHTHERALALLASGQIRVESLITRTITIQDLPKVLSEGPGRHIKTVVLLER